ncbi:multidrug resistance protein CDR1 [Verticillium alfalfae VaMs.102]|uniref:Multidrug resistance protein CDR1 n=1 Tax=Verticillium alfalfae (strain VaMs.102 / ATCC MYA-4576 / FGSC 10136) TaxID=526221 RepID=C9SF44_VERA1|nr:multidrug resistance protein CDR1 [Verticillium alfalfae VaMs.102]EEY17830.1 multidrug resistance protein CDR1 [Verticillium alfalfae VaMs.102]
MYSAAQGGEALGAAPRSPNGSQQTYVNEAEMANHIATDNSRSYLDGQDLGSKDRKAGKGDSGDSTSTSDDDTGNETEMERRHSIVQDLARQYTQHSIVDIQGNPQTLFGSDDPNSKLNPRGEKFSARSWAKTLAKMTTEQGAGFRQAGFCYQNMNVFGYGNETDYQKDVSNVWLEVSGLAKKLTSKTGGQRRIDILQDLTVTNTFAAFLVVSEKRVSIAEATLSNAPLQCWDNSTRGLDSANAVEFCKTLRLQSELFGQTCAVSIYQAPQSAYDLFDKVAVLYEGRQIFFGSTKRAKEYFENLGFDCPARQTVPDFLTSMTAPSERVVRPGWESRVPRSPDDFAAAWKASQAFRDLQVQIQEYKSVHPVDGVDAQAFRNIKSAVQSKNQRLKSPFILSYPQQVKLCLWRGWQRLLGDPSLTVFQLLANSIMGLIISSLFYNMPQTTSAFYSRGVVLFTAILTNAFSSALEILTQYAQRPIVDKHVRYAFYHASAEAYSSVLVDMPYKIANSIVYNLVIYFMTNLNREPGAFFFFLLVSFLMVLTMSGIFRSIASLSRTLSQAMVPASILILALVIFTGFVIPVDYMLGWCRWINYIDPVGYGFEALMINEFHNRDFTCNAFVPSSAVAGYEDISSTNRACSAVGSVAGSDVVNGDTYIQAAYKYNHSHKWRNVGILIGFAIAFHVLYFVASEYISAKKSKGEVLVFRRGALPTTAKGQDDVEGALSGPLPVTEKPNGKSTDGVIQASTSVFHWNNVCYDIKIKGEPRRILDHVDGWVKPGTLTALMGVSGAGKTTLLDCLADRVSMGVITGEMLVDGKIRDQSFQRKTGYVQQQDLHLETTTVREALEFSALLRQPESTPRAEKLAYVDEVIKLLDMQEYEGAVVGVLGEGLNVEQRKRLTIGVELAAKPPLLLFVDEPTSGLDSQTSWAILDLLEKLSKAGQSILCTIHQPSAMLFQRFDRLLFLAKGGRTVYFGDIGENSKTLTNYFERNGAEPCPPGENPAEWMLSAIGAAPGSETNVDWHQAWRDSPEYQDVSHELERLKANATPTATDKASQADDKASFREFASPLWSQLLIVTRRVFEQYWRTPSYIYSKFILCCSVALFIGLVFLDAPLSMQGLQNQMFAIFNILTIFGQLVQQQMPHFVTQRSLYEVRERPSKTYSWKVFMLSQIIVEIPWNSLMSVFMFICVYYPVGLYKNAEAAGQTTERGGLMWLLFWQFLIFTCTFAHACIAITDTAEAGRQPGQRALHDSNCNYCPIADTNVFLDAVSASYDNRWRDFGIGMVYIAFNIAASLALYWLVRMPKGKKKASS